MNIQKRLNQIMQNNLAKLGAHTIYVGSEKIEALPAEVDHDRDLMGGSRNSREVEYEFPTIKGLRLRKGLAVKADGKKWKIDSFSKGVAMTTLRLIEPNRIEE